MILIYYINIPSSDEEVETWVKNFFKAIIVCARARVHTADCATPSPCSSFGFSDMYVSALRASENENPDKAGICWLLQHFIHLGTNVLELTVTRRYKKD